MNRTLSQLEEGLQPRPDQLAPVAPDLSAIRRAGARRRRLRTTGVAVGVGSAVAVLGGAVALGAGALGGSTGTARDLQPLTQPLPEEPSALGRKALERVPGAERVSSFHVSVPAPDAPNEMAQVVAPEDLRRGPVALPAHAYAGVTSWGVDQWPTWLYAGVQRSELAGGDERSGYPVGSFAEGIVVDQGPAYLACVTFPDGLPHEQEQCTPGVLHRQGDAWVYDWGFGTDNLFEEGAPMEVFQDENWSTGEATALVIAGIDGTDVARAEFVTVDGEVVDGTVEAGTVVEGESLLHADVPGDLDRVIAYHADGTVIDDHPLRPCSDPVDCEVR